MQMTGDSFRALPWKGTDHFEGTIYLIKVFFLMIFFFYDLLKVFHVYIYQINLHLCDHFELRKLGMNIQFS